MVLAVLACVLLAALAVFQGLLVAGAPLGALAWGGQHRVLPAGSRVGSAVSIVLYALIAVVVLQAAGVGTLVGAGVVDLGIWVLVGYFALGIGMNAASRSRPERLVMTPVALLLALCCLGIALG
jgi:hypothetical protein